MSDHNELPPNTPAPDEAASGTEAPAAPPPAPEKPEPKPWQGSFAASQRRRAQEAEQRAEREATRARELDAEVQKLRAANPGSAPDANDPAEVERRAEQRATERIRSETEMRDFNAACNSTAERIRAEFGQDGLQKAAQGWTGAGMDVNQKNHRDLLSLISSVDDGHKLYHAIGSDPDLAAHLLEMSPLRAAFELSKHLPREQAAELRAEAVATAAPETPLPPGGTESRTIQSATPACAAAPEPAAPAVSKAPRPPPPSAPSRGASAGSRSIYEAKSMEEYARLRKDGVGS